MHLHSPSPASRAAADLEGFVRDFLAPRPFAVNVAHTPTAFVLTAALPGVERDRIEVSTHEQALILKVKPVAPSDPVEGAPVFDRREFGVFQGERAFSYNPARVDADAFTAKLENGILTVTVPIKVAQARQVTIE